MTDSFEAIPRAKLKASYVEFRAAVLAAGRFSVFEATETPRAAALFTRLCHDPWVEMDISCGYPWTVVRRRDVPKPGLLPPSELEPDAAGREE